MYEGIRLNRLNELSSGSYGIIYSYTSEDGSLDVVLKVNCFHKILYVRFLNGISIWSLNILCWIMGL